MLGQAKAHLEDTEIYQDYCKGQVEACGEHRMGSQGPQDRWVPISESTRLEACVREDSWP